MSHEGIRIVDEREARRIAPPHKLPREAVDPVKVRVHKSEGTGMEIDQYLKDGDLIELEVEGIGVLRNRIAGAI